MQEKIKLAMAAGPVSQRFYFSAKLAVIMFPQVEHSGVQTEG